MTYDKENRSGMDKVQRSGRSRDHDDGSPLLEGEKVIMSRHGRQKRKSYESKLTGINETIDRKPSTKTINENHEPNQLNKEDRFQSSLTRTSERTKSEIKHNVPELRQDKGMQTSEDSLCDDVKGDAMSQGTPSRSRRSSGSDVYDLEKQRMVTNSGRKNAEMESVSNMSGSLKENENIQNDEEFVERKQLRPLKNKKCDHVIANHDNGFKLPDLKCKHLAASKAIQNDPALKKKLKEASIDPDDPNKCIICEITEATANYASVEANRLLLEIVYPHEFYDKFQRSGRRAKGDTKNLEISKIPLTICKPVKVTPKVLNRERSSFSFKPSVTEKLSSNSKIVQSDASDTEQSPQKRIKTDRETGFRKEIHIQCKAKRNALVITDDSDGQKLVLRGLKGWITRKDETCKNAVHKEIKQSLYQVNSLGIQFSVPGTNSSRPDKKLQSPRPFTSIETPRPLDINQAIRRPITGNFSPRKATDQSADVSTEQIVSHHPLRLRRSYTNVPKLFADSTYIDTSSDIDTSSEHKSNNTKKSLDKSVTFYEKPKTRISLPPIGNDMKNRSLTLSQF